MRRLKQTTFSALSIFVLLMGAAYILSMGQEGFKVAQRESGKFILGDETGSGEVAVSGSGEIVTETGSGDTVSGSGETLTGSGDTVSGSGETVETPVINIYEDAAAGGGGSVDDLEKGGLFERPVLAPLYNPMDDSAPEGGILTPNDGIKIGGKVFEDVNFNGYTGDYFQEGIDHPLQNVRVELYDREGKFLEHVSTNDAGDYLFTGVERTQKYTVRVVSASINDDDTEGQGGQFEGKKALPEQVFERDGHNSFTKKRALGGNDPLVDDSDTRPERGIGDTNVTFTATYDNLLHVDFGFSYEVVLNTNDDGQGSLRQFIHNANALKRGNKVHLLLDEDEVIDLRSALPALESSGNTLMPADKSKLLINARGVSNGHAVTVTGDNNTVAQLLIQKSRGNGIALSGEGAFNNHVYGNFIGTDETGTDDVGNRGWGVVLEQGAHHNIIGTNLDGDNDTREANVISGNDTGGVLITDENTTANLVAGNFIGIDAYGLQSVPNQDGVRIEKGANGNTIGNNQDDTLNNVARNIIAYNKGAGVVVTDNSEENRISRNVMYDNTGMAIDLNDDGVTANDIHDEDASANKTQNCPEISSAVMDDNGDVLVEGILDSTAGDEFTIEFYSNLSCDESGFGEGQQYIGSIQVSNFFHEAEFFTSLSRNSFLGKYLSAIAIDSAGNTSEFSSCVTVTDKTGEIDDIELKGYDRYVVPGQTSELWEVFQNIDPQLNIAAGLHSVVDVTAANDDTLIYYDHWEDGLEFNPADIATADESFTLKAGASQRFENTLYKDNPEQQYDGGDMMYIVGSKAQVARAVWPEAAGPSLGAAFKILPVEMLTKSYTLSLGTDMAVTSQLRSSVDRVSAMVQAVADDTRINVGGEERLLVEGETATFLETSVGTKITSDKPVQVHYFAGGASPLTHIAGFTALPDELWSKRYFNAVPGFLAAQGDLFVYNPNASALVVNFEDISKKGTFVVPGKTTVSFSEASGRTTPVGSALSLSADNTFAVVGMVDAAGGNFTWGQTVLPQKTLQDRYVVGWSPGTAEVTPSSSASPVFVAAEHDGTTVSVDFSPVDGNIDTSFTVDGLEVISIFDPDKDNSGMHIMASAPVAVTWGEDADIAQSGNPYLDLGYSVLLPSAKLGQEETEDLQEAAGPAPEHLSYDANFSGFCDPLAATYNEYSPFADVTVKNKHYVPTLKLFMALLVKLYDDGTVKLNEKVTRVDAAKLVLEGAGILIPARYAQSYPDTIPDVWYQPYLNYLRVARFAILDAEGNFGPYLPLRFDQALKMVARSFRIIEEGVYYTPENEIGKYYINLRDNGVLPASLLGKPHSHELTRGELFEMVYKAARKRNCGA